MRLRWLIPSLLASSAFGEALCRCRYEEPCWPDFLELASQLSQPLFFPTPPEAACYPASNPSGNCTDVVQNSRNGNWRSDQAGSMQALNFETHVFGNGTISACYLNASLGIACEQGSIPNVAVDTRSAEDIQAAVKFAAKHNLRTVVKNTGHDFLGRSTARGAFLIWTHRLKNITYNDSFVPDGAPVTEMYKAITLGAGVQWHEAYDAVQSRGRFILGALSAGGSVGAVGGWILGGGHSAFSARYGLGVDNVIQFTVVSADGSHLTVNSHQHSDLFWALRGGGGGTYGITVSVTYLTHKSVPLSSISMTVNFSTPEAAKAVVTEFAKLQLVISDAVWGGYADISPGSLSFFYVAPNISVADANATITPFFASAKNATAGSTTIQALIIPYDSFYSWYLQLYGTGEKVGGNGFMSSSFDEIAETLLSMENGVSWDLICGGAVSKVDPNAAGLNPAWRTAIGYVLLATSWQDGQNAFEVKKQAKSNLDLLDRLVPQGGSYFNEASLFEKDFKQTFFGSHYQKLKAIKKVYDPSALFLVAEGVGSEDWDIDLVCRKN